MPVVLHREFRVGHLDQLVAWHELARHGVTITGPELSTLDVWTDTHVLHAYTVNNLDTYWRNITNQLATLPPTRRSRSSTTPAAGVGLG
ncbi:hypothetical protein ABZ356_15860 [Micromonospora zamorensis]|uniref:hypothetical protein n=1 Tax=Micromonospora zamorensis TaxID=709883 RepID=UPI0034045DAB